MRGRRRRPQRNHENRDLETFASEFVCFVRLTTDSGAVGWGQTSTYNADITATIFHRQIAPWALGADAFWDEALVSRNRGARAQVSTKVAAAARSPGRDTALRGPARQARGQYRSSCSLGGTPRRLRTYASSMRRDISPADEAARLARLRDEHGFDAFKWRIAAECGHDIDEWPGRTEAIARRDGSAP